MFMWFWTIFSLGAPDSYIFFNWKPQREFIRQWKAMRISDYFVALYLLPFRNLLILRLLLIVSKENISSSSTICLEGLNKTYRGLRKMLTKALRWERCFFFSVSDTSSEEKFLVLLNRLRAVSYFSLQSYCTWNLSTRAAREKRGRKPQKPVFSRLVSIPW